MTEVMEGVRVLEVAEHTFVPAASALLADWGADVIKVEPTERGDAMRGLASTGVVSIDGGVHALLEHSNRGKRSLALDLSTPDGLEILHRLVATADVFLTNKLPRVRKKLKIEVEDIRAHNPEHHLRRGHGAGRTGARRGQGILRLLGVLVPGRCLARREAGRLRSAPGPARTGLRGLHRCHDHRRRHHGSPVSPRKDGRGHDGRRLTAGHRACGPWARPSRSRWWPMCPGRARRRTRRG